MGEGGRREGRSSILQFLEATASAQGYARKYDESEDMLLKYASILEDAFNLPYSYDMSKTSRGWNARSLCLTRGL